jgi:hypothetical protein
MSTSIRSLVIPVTDIESAKKTYGAILGKVAPASGSRFCWTPTATRSATRRLISARSQ